MRTYWDMELQKLIRSQNLKENKLIMADAELSEIVNRLG
jgi:hypothetical protein